MKTIAKVLIKDKENNILILRRSITHPNNPHHFDLPGGEIEENETNSDAVKREIYEESGLDVLESSLTLVHEKDISIDVKHLLYTTKIDVINPNITISWEHDMYIWMSMEDILNAPRPNNIDIYFLTVLEYLESVK